MFLAAVAAQAGQIEEENSLIGAWLALPNAGRIAWPYAFIRADSTNASEQAHRSDLFAQLDQLRWRLNEDGYPDLAAAVTQWKNTLAATERYRLPGDWSPAWLMAHPNQRPPISRIAAIGYCKPLGHLSVWDSRGVHSVAWYPGQRLSDVLEHDPQLQGGTTDEVAVVSPQGQVDRYGVAAWNYADTDLTPGMRIVGAIDLKGAVFPWTRDAIAGLLAHTPAGGSCRSIAVSPSVAHD